DCRGAGNKHRCQLASEDIVDLADVRDGILAGCGFQTHGPARRDEAVDAVASADLTVVTSFGGGAGDGEIDPSGGGCVGGIEADLAFRKALFVGKVYHELFDGGLLGQIVLDVLEVAANHGAGDGDAYPVVTAQAHDLDILAPGWMRSPAVSAIDASFGLEHQMFEWAQRSMTDADRGVVGKRDILGARARKQLLQVLRSRSHDGVEADVALR